jgi:hypothetical protein
MKQWNETQHYSLVQLSMLCCEACWQVQRHKQIMAATNAVLLEAKQLSLGVGNYHIDPISAISLSACA